MRIALFNIDSLGSNAAIRAFIQAHHQSIVLVGLSPPFRRARGGIVQQGARHLTQSGLAFSNFLSFNFMLPRIAGLAAAPASTLTGLCRRLGVRAERIDDVNAPQTLDLLRALDVDLIVSCCFDQILKAPVLALPKLGAVNVHSSMLPKNRGPMPVLYGCLQSPPLLGVSLHMIDEGIDRGAIIAQESYQPATGDSILTMMAKLHVQGAGMLGRLLPRIEAAGKTGTRLEGKPQAGGSYESFPSRSTIRALHAAGYRLTNHHDLARVLTTPMTI